MRFLRRNKVLLILFSLAFTLRLILVFTARSIATDGCSYLWLAKDIAKLDFQSGINAFLPPLFPILSAGASFIFRDLEISGRMVSCILGSLTVFPLFFLIKEIFDKKVAVVTVIFFIIHPYLLRASAEVLTEATYFFLVTTLAWVLWSAIRNRKTVFFLLVGFIACLTFLARPEGIAIIFLVFGWIWFTHLSKEKKEFRWKLKASLFFLVAFILILAPFCVHFYCQTGSWRPTTRRVSFVDDKMPGESWLGALIRVLKWKVTFNVPDLFNEVPKAYYPVFLVLLFFGLINRKVFKGYRPGEGYILSFVLFRILVITIFAGVTDRYFYAFVPIALCWAAVGFWEIDNYLLQKIKTRHCRIGKEMISQISVVILLVIGALCLPKGLKPIRTNREIQKIVGRWLKENAKKEEFIVVAPKPQEAFYAGAKYYGLKKDSYEGIINQAREVNADFVIVDKNIEDICPGFSSVVKKEDLEVCSAEFLKSDRKIIIYKLTR